MHIRWIPFISIATLIAVGAGQVFAGTTCTPSPSGQLCTSRIDVSAFAESAHEDSFQSQWCWAASVSTMFAYYGHTVGQTRLVADVYGAPADMPATAGIAMARALNRSWTDDLGDSFTSRVTGIYDDQAGVYELTDQRLVNELGAGRPLLIGTRTEAMVLTALRYDATDEGLDIVDGEVFDPRPGVGARASSDDELRPAHLGGSLHFAATVDVSDHAPPPAATSPRPSPASKTPSFGCTCRSTPETAPVTDSSAAAFGLCMALLIPLRRRGARRR